MEHSEIDVNREDDKGLTPLMEASRHGYNKVVELILFHPDVSVNKVAWDNGYTALMFACDDSRLEVVDLLLRCPKTDVSYLSNNFETAYHFASTKNMTEITEAFKNRAYLISIGHTCCSWQMKRGLQIAARNNDLEATTYFLRCYGIDLNEGYESGLTPLYIASREGYSRIVQHLLQNNKIDVNRISNGENALIVAAEKGYTDVVSLLVDFPAIDININKRGSEGSALFLASTNGYSMIVEILLLQAQIEVNGVYGPEHSTSLITSSAKGFLSVIKLLLRCPKTDINLENLFGDTAFDVSGSAVKDAINMRDELLKETHTCCLNATKVLLKIAKIGDFRGIRGLARCPNADINEQDLKGRTGLYLASLMGHMDAVYEFLVLPNIDVNKELILTGETAYSIASKKSHFDVMKILSQHRNVDVNKGWFRDFWTTFDSRQQFQSDNGNVTNSWELKELKVAETGKE